MKIGYARVSTRSQGDSLDTQEAILREKGCERVYRDTISGARSSRPGFDQMLAALRPGDELFATRLDRLGRTALDTLHTIDRLNSEGVHVVVLKPEIDTRTKEGKLMAGIMAHLAEFERDLLVERTREGLAAARARGREGGRPPSISEKKRSALVKAVGDGESVAEAAKLLGISRSHAYRILGEEGRG
ncbi:MAG: recombinase family protein [Propionibacteriaceae bacterium]|nr:recombinase family protein [Propionibacteriaceae bacterium]